MRGAPVFFNTWSGLGRVLAVGTIAYAALVAILRISGKRTLTRLGHRSPAPISSRGAPRRLASQAQH
jgi:hypothetical protein